MIEGMLTLLLFQVLGESVSHLANWPVPGPIFGLMLMVIWAALGGKLAEPAVQVARGLMNNLGLMFVPVAAGILFQLRSLGDAAWHVVWIVVVATVVTLLATAATFAWLARATAKDVS